MSSGMKTLIGAVVGFFVLYLILGSMMGNFWGLNVITILLVMPGAIIGAIIGHSMGSDENTSSEKNDNNEKDDNANGYNYTQIDYSSELSEYKQLLDVGILTQEEFDKKKRETLKNIMLAYSKGAYSDKSNIDMLMNLKNMQDANLITKEEMLACKKLIMNKGKTSPKKKEYGDELTADEINEIEEVYDPNKVWNETDGDSQTPIDTNHQATNLIELKKLLDSGVITQEEYDKKKKEFLEKL